MVAAAVLAGGQSLFAHLKARRRATAWTRDLAGVVLHFAEFHSLLRGRRGSGACCLAAGERDKKHDAKRRRKTRFHENPLVV